MSRTVRPPSAAEEIAQLRAEIRVLQAVVANMAASQSTLFPDPADHLAQWGMRAMGFAHGTSRECPPGHVSQRTSTAVVAMVGWAEGYLRALISRK